MRATLLKPYSTRHLYFDSNDGKATKVELTTLLATLKTQRQSSTVKSLAASVERQLKAIEKREADVHFDDRPNVKPRVKVVMAEHLSAYQD